VSRNETVSIDTVALPEGNVRSARKMLKMERQFGRLAVQAATSSDLTLVAVRMQACRCRPHYHHGTSASEGAQATCDAARTALVVIRRGMAA